MANSSLDEIVQKYPIEYNFLQPILGRLQDAERVYMTDESGDETCRKSVLRLLSVLHTQDAAFNIPTKTRNQDVASGLEGLRTYDSVISTTIIIAHSSDSSSRKHQIQISGELCLISSTLAKPPRRAFPARSTLRQ
ncbi:hypothetical protein D8B26_000436 [Coccidioides posadasii str. Silveira]|uniref:uncharacterized protein n=1 Tax=Coccidioides posadasii (strain RMSCC 757 / Silveira) TaxID=443226 RepID=UPI001BED8935|nr:hypothetical protein D8B26_000436 [Coccidioides posadasii str. Silveira]